MPEPKFLLDLGLVKKAGRGVFGFDEVAKAIDLGDARTVFFTADTAANTKKKLERLCADYEKTPVCVPFSTFDIGRAAGRKPTAVFTVTDKGFDALLHRSLEMNGGKAE